MKNKPRRTTPHPNRLTRNQSPARRSGAIGVSPGRWVVWALLPVLLAAVLAAYHPAWHGKMLWDDDRHLTRPDLRPAQGLWRIWFDLGATQQYYPLTHSAFWFQYRIWGDDRLGYHLVNIVLHALAAFLVALVLRRLAIPGAALAAVIFALHPVHVESVAWMTELKNTLSGVLYLGAALAYLKFDDSRQKRWYAPALFLFILALLTKTVTATLPAALLVIFWWQRGKIDWRRDVVPLAPWFALGAFGGLVTAWVERTLVGAQGAEYQLGLIERLLLAGRVVWFYLGKLFWPSDLIFMYPRWQVSRSIWWQYLFPSALAALLGTLWAVRNRSRAPLAALLLFVGTLFPVLGFFDVYPFRYSFVADHFQYLASIAVIALFAAGVTLAVRRWTVRAVPAQIAVFALCAGLLALPTWSQSRQYADAEVLYRTTLSRNPHCWMAWNNLGNVLQAQGRLQEAVDNYREAVKLKPDYAEAYNNLGDALHGLRRLDEAEAAYREAIRLMPSLAGAYYNLGNALQESGRFEAAVAQYQEALRLEPDMPEAQGNMGAALEKLGRIEEALEHYRQAVRLRPGYAIAVRNLGNALVRLGRFQEGEAQYREAIRLRPDFVDAYVNLGSALQAQGRPDEAAAQYEAALRVDPNSAAGWFHLGLVRQHLGLKDEAVACFREVVRLAPDLAEAHNGLGIALADSGRLDEAARCFREAVRLKPDFADARANLARLTAQSGRRPGP